MTKYNSADSNAGVIAFETGHDFIKIKFRDGSIYLYTVQSTGASEIAKMKALAKEGVGLTTYINQYVRDRYQSKLK